MTTLEKPTQRPVNPNFGSGPTAKHPGFDLAKSLADTPLGRSHRSSLGKNKIVKSIQDCHRLLELPADYLIGIVPGGDTGAFEMAMWNLLGDRPVDVCCWDTFGKGWLVDAVSELKLDVRKHEAAFGDLPDLTQTKPEHDIVFTWNGTTSGVKIPNSDWISDTREGLTLCDATSSVFAMAMPWEKLDVVTFSWQKVLGGEGAHGMIILSPRAVTRLETFTPPRPIPKIFRLTSGGKFLRDIFVEGAVINTPSMLCVEDFLDALAWAESVGGVKNMIQISQANLKIFEDFVESRPWIHFLAKTAETRSNTSVCFTVDLPKADVDKMVALLSKEGAAYDIGAYRDAPPGLRVWCAANVVDSDLRLLLPWLDWAYAKITTPE